MQAIFRPWRRDCTRNRLQAGSYTDSLMPCVFAGGARFAYESGPKTWVIKKTMSAPARMWPPGCQPAGQVRSSQTTGAERPSAKSTYLVKKSSLVSDWLMLFLPYSMPQSTDPETMHRIPIGDTGKVSAFASAGPAGAALGAEDASGPENFSVREVLSELVDALDQGRGLVTIEGWQGPSVVVAGDRRGFKAVARECLDHALRHRRAQSVAVLVATDAVSWGQYRVRMDVSYVGSRFSPVAGEWWFAPPRFWRRMLGRITLVPESRLWVCRGLVRKLGGSVGVSGKGRRIRKGRFWALSYGASSPGDGPASGARASS